MKRCGALVLWAMTFLTSTVQAEMEEPVNVLDQALEEVGLSRSDFHPDPLIMFQNRTGQAPSPMLRTLLSSPLSAAYRIGMMQERYVEYSDSPHRLFLNTIGFTNASIARGYMGNPFRSIDSNLANNDDPLLAALKDLYKVGGEEWSGGELPTLEQLPAKPRLELARLIAVIASSERFRTRALRNAKLPEPGVLALLRQVFASQFDPDDTVDYRLEIPNIEEEALYAGMLDLVLAMEDFESGLTLWDEGNEFQWELKTPLGDIVINTRKEDSLYTIDDALLYIDLYGDDEYVSAREGGLVRSGISILFDARGNDRNFLLPGRGASGIYGYGIQWDLEGDDVYIGGDLTQASAVFGASLLYDAGGNDRYEAIRGSQSYALGGAALLVDLAGDDTYESAIRSQACGDASGAAVLFDVEGNDVYTLKSETIYERSAQSPSNNNSLGQGVGVGLRADLGDGRSLAGGVGALIDMSGDDVYTAEVFAQGTGFLEGVGIHFDGAGSDQFHAVWYGQASSAHRAAGVLINRGTEDDVYTVEKYTGIGAGHDLSTAFFLDEGGNDRYSVRNLGIGGANDNGTAIFCDVAGDDTYHINDKSGHGLGGAMVTHWGTSRESALGVGIFLDLEGNDTYEVRREGPTNDTTFLWTQKFPDLHLNSDLGVGIDGVYTSPFTMGAKTPSDGSARKQFEDARQERRSYRK